MSGGEWRLNASAFMVRKFVDGLGLTYRHRSEEGAERLRSLREAGEPAILSFWHNRILFTTHYLRGALQLKGYPLSVMISRSRDGELIARVVEAWGVATVRGSSSRGGTRALRELARWLDDQRGGAVTTPDGPRGPAYRVQPGTVLLAQLTGVPVYPVSSAAERAWRLPSWDRFIIPRPFSRVATAVGEPVVVPRDLDREGREAARCAIEEAMLATDRRAEAAFLVDDRRDR